MVKPQPIKQHWISASHGGVTRHKIITALPEFQVLTNSANVVDTIEPPFGRRGDRLWVRETWAQHENHRAVAYRADGLCGAWGGDGDGGRIWVRHGGLMGPEWSYPESWRGQSFGLDYFGGRWKSSIHMPRWASRLTLDITGVRVERLQDIGEHEAEAEGCRATRGMVTARDEYALLWDNINGKRSPWANNPWVWVIEFQKALAPEDSAEGP